MFTYTANFYDKTSKAIRTLTFDSLFPTVDQAGEAMQNTNHGWLRYIPFVKEEEPAAVVLIAPHGIPSYWPSRAALRNHLLRTNSIGVVDGVFQEIDRVGTALIERTALFDAEFYNEIKKELPQ